MNPQRKNKIVRVKFTYHHNESDKQYYEIKLMTFKEWSNISQYIEHGTKKERYKYKWWNLNLIWEIPSFLILKRVYKASYNSVSKIKIVVTRLSVFIIESVFAGGIWFLVEGLIKRMS